jgi:hypothetical protein
MRTHFPGDGSKLLCGVESGVLESVQGIHHPNCSTDGIYAGFITYLIGGDLPAVSV